MLTLPETLNLPLKRDAGGAIRVSGTRVLLEMILWGYLRGDSPEAIHAAYERVPVADIHAVIAYYLANRESVDAYLADVEAQGEHWRKVFEARSKPLTRAELEARMAAKRQKDQ